MKKIVSFDAGDTLFKGTAFNNIQDLCACTHDAVNLAFKQAYKTALSEWKDLDLFATSSTISAFWADVYIATLKSLVENRYKAIRLYTELMHIREHGDWYKLRDGVKETLERLRNDDYKIIVSSNWSSDLEDILNKLDLIRYFDKIYTSAELGVSKPNEKFYEFISSRESTTDIIHFGDDEENDVNAPSKYAWKGVHLTKGDDFSKIVLNELSIKE